MSADDTNPAGKTPPATGETPAGKASGTDARAERLSAALKANLRRRKAQARGRKAGDDAGPEGGGGRG